jgi:hypothetical protein
MTSRQNTSPSQNAKVTDWNRPFSAGSFWDDKCHVTPAYKPGPGSNPCNGPQIFVSESQKRACVVHAQPSSAQRGQPCGC